jgi:hypothetical protein
MVRRDETERGAAEAEPSEGSSCASPAGESPVPVSVGAPGSRPQPLGRDPDGRAGSQEPARRREPCSGEQRHGPQHEVKLAASTERQSWSRAAHVTAKATSTANDPKRVVGPGGVESAARVEGEARNTGDPSASPSSGQGAPYKPEAKSVAAQRESEGTTVPKSEAGASRTNVVQNNAAGGKGPCGGRVGGGGKREGMTEETRSNHPCGPQPAVKVQQLQDRLGDAAKRHPERRFHALYDRIARSDVLAEAWKRVRRNKGAAGVDAQTIASLEEYGVERFLEELRGVLLAGEYRQPRCCAATYRRPMGRGGRLGFRRYGTE